VLGRRHPDRLRDSADIVARPRLLARVALASLAATPVRIRLSFAAWIEAESLFSAAVVASAPSARP
jgi:hypothetical protein